MFDSALDREARSLVRYLDELQDKFDALPLTDPERLRLEARMVEVERELMAREGL